MGETITNGTQNFRRSKSSDAHENGCELNHARSNWDLGIFRYSRKIKSAINTNKNYGKRSGREYGVPYQVAEGVTLGSLPADSEQFMLIEELYKQTDKQQTRIDDMLHNAVNIEALETAVLKLQSDVEKLKDKQRSYSNGGQ